MKYKIFRYFAYALEIIVFFIIERTPRLIPEIFGEKAIIIVPILFMIALFEGEKAGLGFGLFIGILIIIVAISIFMVKVNGSRYFNPFI